MKRSFFIASTGQHVGKTTLCLGLFSGILKHHSTVGFMKPIGQEHVEMENGVKVDKDVILFKDFFNLTPSYSLMSPVIFPKGFTRDYLDGKIHKDTLEKTILHSFHEISQNHSFTLIEGTGHVGVGSIVDLNNAQVAKLMKAEVILVGSGGLGSTFDALALNKKMCEEYGINIAGVILNRVLDDKRDMVLEYMSKALSKWNIPLIGAIPHNSFLSSPCIKDFESLFSTTLLSGEEFRLRHFRHMRLVATSVETYRHLIIPSQLVITPANREDIILATLTKHWETKIHSPENDLEAGMILTGSIPPRKEIIELLKEAHIPMLYAAVSSFPAMQMITSHIAKIRKEDTEKVNKAIDLVQSFIDMDRLLNL